MTDERDLTPLARFMKEQGHRDQWLADLLGVSQPQASRIKRGGRTSPERAFKIETATEGAVKAGDVLLAANDTGPAAANDAAAPDKSDAA